MFLLEEFLTSTTENFIFKIRNSRLAEKKFPKKISHNS